MVKEDWRYSWLFLLLALGLIISSQIQTDRLFGIQHSFSGAGLPSAQSLNAPNSQLVKLFDLGFHRAAADLIWLSTIQYFGGSDPNAPYPSLNSLLTTITTVDPKFEYPYLFGGIILPWQNQSREALVLLQKGMTIFPQNGLFPYNAGAIAKIHLQDSSLAAQYFRQSIGLQNTPLAAPLLAGVSLTESDDRQFALKWWQSILDSDAPPAIKERAQAWHDHLQLVIDLEALIKKTEQERHVTITSLNDFVRLGILKEVPASPLKQPLIYNPTTHRVDINPK